VWNQVVLVLFGITVLFSTVTGWVMWLRRPRRGVLGLFTGAALTWLMLLLVFAALWLTVEVQARRQPTR
jgi:uncharacterized iron-regulated membrane protein